MHAQTLSEPHCPQWGVEMLLPGACLYLPVRGDTTVTTIVKLCTYALVQDPTPRWGGHCYLTLQARKLRPREIHIVISGRPGMGQMPQACMSPTGTT